MRGVWLGLFALLLGPAWAEPAAAEKPPDLEWFTRPGCPHCARAEEFVADLSLRRPELRILKRNVAADPGALARLKLLARGAPAAVPSFYARGRLIVGFSDETTTGRALEELLSPGAERAVTLPLAGRASLRELGLPLFTILLGLADGFNPCAMWVLLFLLSLLVNMGSRAKMALVAGTFIGVGGAVYFLFMAAWLNMFLFIGFSRNFQRAVGVLALAAAAVHVKDFFAFKKGFSLSIPESAKPGLYERMRKIVLAENIGGALLSVAALAVLVNLVELACTAGLPAIYTQILASQGLTSGRRYGYLALYNAAYMLDDSLVLAAAIAAFSRWKLGERGGRRLKLVSGAVLAALGLALLLKPEWLLWG